MSRTALLALASLSVLAAGLVIERSFRWIGLLRAGAINLTLIAFGHYAIFHWLLRPVPGEPGQRYLIVPPTVRALWLFSAFLIAAWVGCRVPARAGEPNMPLGDSSAFKKASTEKRGD